MGQISKLVWSASAVPADLAALLRTLGEEYQIDEHGRGLKLKFRKVKGSGIVSNVIRARGEVTVEYNSLAGAGRGVGAAFADLDGAGNTPFETLGIMLDLSRNMVMTTEHLKCWLRRLCLSGYNQLQLYCEDTYQLEDEPMFGFMRGAYSLEEIQELDEYASRLGIELVGCIQTLGHCEQILKWSNYRQVRDTERVLMADEPETMKLIEKMIVFWKNALKSRRIHIGMDETHDLGRGRFLDRNGFENGFELFNRHLDAVNALCKKHEMAPQIWSDMYFRLANPDQNYYDLSRPVPPDVKAKIPKNVQLVYWDYYHTDAEFYEKMISAHRDLGFEPVMASGIWTWAKLWYDHEQTATTVVPCVKTCRKMKLRELIFTMWGDDGAYCNYDSSLAGVVFAADVAFGQNDPEATGDRFHAVCGGVYGAVLAAAELNYRAQSTKGELFTVSPSAILWDDPLQGMLFDFYKQFDPEFDLRLLDHCEDILCRILPFVEVDEGGDMEHAVNMTKALIKKLELRGALEAAYDSDDRIALRELATTHIPAAVNAMREFDASFRRQWMECAKPFGLERIQARNAGQIARLEETALRIMEYLAGEVQWIDELEERVPSSQIADGVFGRYKGASSASWII